MKDPQPLFRLRPAIPKSALAQGQFAYGRWVIVVAISFLGLSVTASAAPPKHRAATPPPRAGGTAAAFTSNEITLLYEACTQSGGSVSIKGGEFSCIKTGAPQAPQREAQSVPQPTLGPPPRKGKYTGAELADLNSGSTSGDITRVHTIGEVIPLIRVGVTTRAQIVAALKEPVRSSFDSTGGETTMFIQNVSLGKSGGFMQLLTKRGPAKKILTVIFKQGVVSYFAVQDQR